VDSTETIERVPIHTDADGVVRVAGTRVTLDTIVVAFEAGATAEEIVQHSTPTSFAVFAGASRNWMSFASRTWVCLAPMIRPSSDGPQVRAG
jgi:hypothetical protein